MQQRLTSDDGEDEEEVDEEMGTSEEQSDDVQSEGIEIDTQEELEFEKICLSLL